jgi:hypothetical protein
MPPPPARKQVRPYRRGQQTNAARGRLAARAALASARARAAAPPPPGRPARRGFRARPHLQPAVPAGGGDESDPEDGRILEPAGDGWQRGGAPWQ